MVVERKKWLFHKNESRVDKVRRRNEGSISSENISLENKQVMIR